MVALAAEMRGQAKRDAALHSEIFKLIEKQDRLMEKQDERMDREHDERVQLSIDIRELVKEVALQVRDVTTRLAVIGAVIIIGANILGPIAAPIIAKAIALP